MAGLVLDIVARTSKVGGRKNLRSPDRQVQTCTEWIVANGHTVGSVLIAKDEFGNKKTHPVIEEAVARAHSGESDGFVVAYASRYARNSIYGLTTARDLIAASKFFHSVDCPEAPCSRKAMTWLAYELAKAEEAWHEYKEGFDVSREEAIAKGVHLAVPFGYMRDEPGTPLQVNPAEAPTVVAAYELRAAGHGAATVAGLLNDRGLTTRKGGRWTHKTVKQMLASEVYLGVAFSGDFRREGSHERIVDRKLWSAANSAASTHTKHERRDPDGYLLTGLVRCTGCGYTMMHNPQKDRRYYTCKATNQRTNACPQPVNVPAAALEEWVDDVMGQFTDPLTGRLKGHSDDSNVRQAEAVAADCEATLERLMGEQARTPNASATKLRILNRQVDEADQALLAAQAEVERQRDSARGMHTPSQLRAIPYAEWPVADRRQLVATYFAGIAARPAATFRQDVRERVAPVLHDEIDQAGGQVGEFFRGFTW
jgi:site-specific DNA recombinase